MASGAIANFFSKKLLEEIGCQRCAFVCVNTKLCMMHFFIFTVKMQMFLMSSKHCAYALFQKTPWHTYAHLKAHWPSSDRAFGLCATIMRP